MALAKYCLVALGCPDAPAVAEFSAGVLGGEVKRYSDDGYGLYAPGGHRIAFQRAPG